MSNYTNELKKDLSLICKQRLTTPSYIIKFGKTKQNMFIVWDGNIITRYKGQAVKSSVAMKPYLDDRYNPERRQTVIDIFDAQGYKFDTLITLSYFQGELQKVRK
jgi:hypothetical protein